MRNLALALIIIGAINCGLIGLFGYDLILNLFGSSLAIVSRFLLVLVGLAGIYAITFFWDKKKGPSTQS